MHSSAFFLLRLTRMGYSTKGEEALVQRRRAYPLTHPDRKKRFSSVQGRNHRGGNLHRRSKMSGVERLSCPGAGHGGFLSIYLQMQKHRAPRALTKWVRKIDPAH
uniref:Uncharacterized protein n=1 Tax=Physcomitrium patens TaxID=3218 RepID=A0A2K1IBB1_PHYPA|nr:hypothetical protein PHYPA_030051 [Physcomitrium patens]